MTFKLHYLEIFHYFLIGGREIITLIFKYVDVINLVYVFKFTLFVGGWGRGIRLGIENFK